MCDRHSPQVYLGYGFSFLFGVYVTRLDVLGWGWRASYILAGLPGIALAAAMLLLPGNYHLVYLAVLVTPSQITTTNIYL